MPTRRQARINELLMEELSLLIPGRTSDPALTDVSITRVQSTQDLGTAKVFYTLAPGLDDAEQAAAAEALEHAAGHLRHELAGLGLRRVPRLVFARDKGFESGQRVLDLLDRIGHEQAPEPAASSDDEADRGES